MRYFLMPVLRGSQDWFAPAMSWGMSPGLSMDPFVAIIQHSCMGNVHMTYEGSELRIRALRPISKNEEILMPWVEFSDELSERTTKILRDRALACSCQTCRSQTIQNANSTNKSLQDEGRRLLKASPNESLSLLPEIVRVIAGLRQTSLEAGSHLMRHILHRATMGYTKQARIEDVVKAYLRIYYVVETNASSPTRRLECFTTLHALRSLLDKHTPEDIGPRHAPRFPKRIILLTTNIYSYVSTSFLHSVIA
jgi:hypothetical protein